jgi:hypothetical protein
MNTDEVREEDFMECIRAVMYAKQEEEVEAVREAVAIAVERGWLGATAASRAARLIAANAPLEAARLLVPAGWSVAVLAVDPRTGRSPPTSAEVEYVARSMPESMPTDPMAVRFGPEDECHMPDHGFSTAALALCGEAMMLQSNVEEELRVADGGGAGGRG